MRHSERFYGKTFPIIENLYTHGNLIKAAFDNEYIIDYIIKSESPEFIANSIIVKKPYDRF